jgi:hypothetical protein
VTVGNLTILTGNGSSAGTIGIQDGGTIAPGTSPGELSGEALNLTTGAIFSADIAGPEPVVDYDTISVAGPVTIDGATLAVSLFYAPPIGQQFTIISQSQDEPVNGTFADLPEGATFSVEGTTFAITYAGGSGNDVVLVVEPTPTPTPTPTETQPTTPTSTATPTTSGAPATATSTPTTTGTTSGCTGDCDDDGTVAVDELVTAVGISLDEIPDADCPQLGGGASVTVAVIVEAVGNALSDCP